MKTLILAAIRGSLVAMTLFTGVAKANTISTFDVFGTFTTPYSGTFGGTLTMDVTNGTVSSVDIIFPGLADFNFLVQSHPWPLPPGWYLAVGNGTMDALDLTFTTTMPNSLVGFNGGTITGGVVFDLQTFQDLFVNFSGTIAPTTVADPASTLVLLALGAGGLLALRRRRRAT
jgi:MYXO-CTERM domain-containing protein